MFEYDDDHWECLNMMIITGNVWVWWLSLGMFEYDDDHWGCLIMWL